MDKYLNKIIQGDCLDKMREMENNSVDTIVTDPPYGLSFMGKKWDYDVPSVEIWKEALRVLKPGGTALIFAGSRTQHRMAINVEDAGFILKDTIMWLYGSGFPKATDISKQLDKLSWKNKDKEIEFVRWLKSNLNGKSLKDIDNELGTDAQAFHYFAESNSNRQIPNNNKYKIVKRVLGLSDEYDGFIKKKNKELDEIRKIQGYKKSIKNWDKKYNKPILTEPATPEAKLWNGWKSHGLKPAYEPILVAMKPNDGTYANNALKWGVSGLNIDAGRVGNEEIIVNRHEGYNSNSLVESTKGKWTGKQEIVQGRFPANIILDEEAGKMLDEQSGVSKSKQTPVDKGKSRSIFVANQWKRGQSHNDKGGASRFFYCAKASKKERNAGCEGLEEKQTIGGGGGIGDYKDDVNSCSGKYGSEKAPANNFHPTVKPLKLMEYLVKLTSMPNPDQVYLDPFMGSGTTGIACKKLGCNFIGIEMDKDYCKIAKARIKSVYTT